MTISDDKIQADRTEGCRGDVGVNPSVVHFTQDFSPLSKPPKPLKIDELRLRAYNHGFIDGLAEESEYFLNRISYQHASGYFGLFTDKSGKIIDGASMRTLHRIILFDRKFQALFMEYIGLFELQFRAQYSYRLSMKRGAFAHRDSKNFKEKKYFKHFLFTYEKEIKRQIKNKNKTVIEAYKKYGDVPTWIAVELMSFGTLSMLYSNTRSRDVRDGVAESFGVTQEELTSWARSISGIRNTCAHFGQICGKNLVSRPKKIHGAEGDNGNPFYVALVLLKLLNTKKFFRDDTSLSYGALMLRDIFKLFNEFEDILELARIPHDWRDLLSQESVLGIEVRRVKHNGRFRRWATNKLGLSHVYVALEDNKGNRTLIDN